MITLWTELNVLTAIFGESSLTRMIENHDESDRSYVNLGNDGLVCLIFLGMFNTDNNTLWYICQNGQPVCRVGHFLYEVFM